MTTEVISCKAYTRSPYKRRIIFAGQLLNGPAVFRITTSRKSPPFILVASDVAAAACYSSASRPSCETTTVESSATIDNEAKIQDNKGTQ
jgi:hypothetical protein